MDGYYSITITYHGLIRLIGFVSQISTHLLKNFINKFYLILLNGKIIFYVTGAKKTNGNKQSLSKKFNLSNIPFAWIGNIFHYDPRFKFFNLCE